MTTMADIFGEDTFFSPDAWDVAWIKSIQIPESLPANQMQAIKLMTETARAIDWCGEKIALLVNLTESAKDEYKNIWTQGYMNRTRDKTAGGRKLEADSDPEYLKFKAQYNKLKGYLEFFQKKQESFIHAHYAMKEIVKATQNETKVSGWDTTDDVYQKRMEEQAAKNSETSQKVEEVEDLELD